MKDYARYATSVLFFIGVIILVIIGFNLIRNILKDDSPPAQQGETRRNVNLPEEAKSGKAVRYTIKGSVVGNEEYRSVRITVDRDNRLIEAIQGYDGQVLKSQQTPNTPQAYDAFIAAINGAGFTRRVDGENRGDEAQTCPLGRKFNYEVAPGTSDAFRTWSASCGNRQGTFGGNHGTIETLFRRQIPQHNDFMRDIRFSGYTN